MEVEFLAQLRYNLFVSPQQWEEWNRQYRGCICTIVNVCDHARITQRLCSRHRVRFHQPSHLRLLLLPFPNNYRISHC
jgi:hypothetical protein